MIRSKGHMRVAAATAFLLAVATTTAGQSDAIDVADGSCGRGAMIAVLGGARVYASCERDGSESVMHISVTNLSDPSEGALRGFSIGFCGSDIISASAPTGWIVTIDPEKNDADWSVAETVPEDLVDGVGVPSHARMGGFDVRLRAGWRRSRSAFAQWRDTAFGRAATHDCPRVR